MERRKENREKRDHFVYRLRCPLTQKIRYIGITWNPKARLAGHAVLFKSAYDPWGKVDWVVSLRKVGLKPIMEVVSPPLPYRVAQSWEIRLQFLFSTLYPGQLTSPPIRLKRVRTESYALSINTMNPVNRPAWKNFFK